MISVKILINNGLIKGYELYQNDLIDLFQSAGIYLAMVVSLLTNNSGMNWVIMDFIIMDE